MHCGGAERSLLSLLNNLDPKKYEIDLLVIKKGGEFEQFIPKWINYKSLDLNFSLFGRIKYKLFTLINTNTHKAQLFWRAFNNQINIYPEKYDIAIGWGQGFATYYVAEKIKADKRFVWVNIDYEKAGYKFKYDKNIYKKFDKIVGVSEYVKISMQKFIKDSKVVYIRNIIDADDIKFRAQQSKTIEIVESQFTILSIGRLAKQKVFELSIDTAKVLKDKDIDFIWYIIGEGSERKYLENLIDLNNLTGKVILLGFRDNPYPYLKACDIYVQTSKFEGLGRTLIEASILCKPIVTTNFPTAYVLVEDGKTGFVTEMKAEKIADKIAFLHSDKNLYTEMVEGLASKKDNEKQTTLDKVYKLFDS
jgi:glycosyltransferase involved in cell wall biosynthesis